MIHRGLALHVGFTTAAARWHKTRKGFVDVLRLARYSLNGRWLGIHLTTVRNVAAATTGNGSHHGDVPMSMSNKMGQVSQPVRQLVGDVLVRACIALASWTVSRIYDVDYCKDILQSSKTRRLPPTSRNRSANGPISAPVMTSGGSNPSKTTFASASE